MDKRLRPRAPDSGHYEVDSDEGGETWAILATVGAWLLASSLMEGCVVPAKTVPAPNALASIVGQVRTTANFPNGPCNSRTILLIAVGDPKAKVVSASCDDRGNFKFDRVREGTYSVGIHNFLKDDQFLSERVIAKGGSISQIVLNIPPPVSF